jgi:hypothetical protein
MMDLLEIERTKTTRQEGQNCRLTPPPIPVNRFCLTNELEENYGAADECLDDIVFISPPVQPTVKRLLMNSPSVFAVWK